MKLIKRLCPVVIMVALGVYLIADTLFRTAILRDKSSSLLEKQWMKRLLAKSENASKKVREGKNTSGRMTESGFRFSDFNPEIENGRKWFQGQIKERIAIKAKDGVTLIAYFLPAVSGGKKVLILIHGYRNNEIRDFAGLVRFYHEMGYHLLVVHQRSHGESEGNYISFGVKERYDVKQWAEYVVRRFERDCSIFLTGISMGASTVLMAAGLELPGQVRGIIADCAFTSMWEMFGCVLRRDCHLPIFPFLHVADKICRRRAGFGFRDCHTVSDMKENKIPVLFIHGGRDALIPIEMSYRNFEACSAKKMLLMIERAGHGTCHLTEPEVYRSTVRDFMEKCEHED